MDLGEKLTEKELAKLEKRIEGVYKEAKKDLQKTIDDYFDKFKDRDENIRAIIEDAEAYKDMVSGTASESLSPDEYYRRWRLAQIGRGERFEAMRDVVAERVTEANEVAIQYLNEATPSIYALNRNYSNYYIESISENVSFDIFDESTVRRLVTEFPDVMPNYPKARAVARGIDLEYGKKQITKHVTSGIVRGLSIPQMEKELRESITSMNQTSAIRAVRTGVTNAQNAGRQDSYDYANKTYGLNLKKEWIATRDARTRPEHGAADGQIVDFDKPFSVGGDKLKFPGDSSGHGWNIYNCRCTMRAFNPAHPYEDNRQTFSEWIEEKENTEEGIAKAGRLEANGRFVNKTEKLYRYAEKVTPIEGYEDFTCHADKDQFLIDMTGEGDEENFFALTPEYFAEAIKNSKSYNGGNVRLISCQAGASEDGAAQRVADYLQVNVLAPTEIVNLDENGEMFITNNDILAEIWYYANEEERKKMKQTGKWVIFKPRKE